MDIPQLDSVKGNLPLGFRFSVAFMKKGGILNPIDVLFQKVSGIGSRVETSNIEGGQQTYAHQLPTKTQYDNLVLERGLMVASPLVDEFNKAIFELKFSTFNVLVSLLDSSADPITSWLFFNAYPVKWQITDFNADDNNIVIETMELTYQRMQRINV